MHPLMALVWGICIFAVATWIRILTTDYFRPYPAWVSQVVFQITLVGLGFLAFAKSRLSWDACGFRKVPVLKFVVIYLLAMGLGVLTSMIMVLTPAKGLNMLAQYSLVTYVVFIWFFSSVAEEIFVRGWMQSAIRPSVQGKCCGLASDGAVLSSALLFGAMHLAILLRGVDGLTAVILIPATFLLGFLCAFVRQKSGSLFPAIIAHVLFNMGAFVGGLGTTFFLMVKNG